MMIPNVSQATPMAGAWAQTEAAEGGMSDLAAALGIPVGEAGGESAEGQGADFGGAMAVAEMLAGQAQSSMKTDPALKASSGQQWQMGSSVRGKAEGGVSVQEAGKFDKVVPRGLGGGEEQASLIQKMAVSSNTGAEVAGLKPWSKDWVMEGGLNRHPAQKTLLGDARGGSADVTSSLAEMAKLVGSSAANSRGSVKAAGQSQEMDPELLSALQAAGLGGQLEGLEGMEMVPAQAQAAIDAPAPARKKSLSSEDFLSARQAASPEQATQSVQSQKNPKVLAGALPGGLQSPVLGQVAGSHDGSTLASRPRDPKLGTGISSDTLGLIHPEMNAKSGMAKSALPFAAAEGSMKLDGAVVPGSMQRNRLSSESVLGVSQGIRELKASGGGEMRLRLKPDHLGEIHLKVSAGGKVGNEIGLQIQASDERAKKILEESIGSLKEGLAGQNLSLSKLDIQVAQPGSSSSASNSFSQDGQSNSPFAQQDSGMSGQNASQGGNRQSERGESGRPDGLRSGQSKSASQAFAGAARASSARSAGGNGRLDLMA